jgi:hypothetical protein
VANTFPIIIDNAILLAAIRKCIELPEHITSLDLHMEMDELPVVTCTFKPIKKDGYLELTTLDDKVRRYAYVG